MASMIDLLPDQDSPAAQKFKQFVDQSTVYGNLIEIGLRKDVAYWLASHWPSEQTLDDAFWIAVISAVMLGMIQGVI